MAQRRSDFWIQYLKSWYLLETMMNLQFAHSDLVVAVLSSLLDILVVAYLIYRVLLLIRGTRAQQILMGLGVIAFAFFASRVLKLNTLSWILENFIGSFLLIVIVLFQNPTLRLKPPALIPDELDELGGVRVVDG